MVANNQCVLMKNYPMLILGKTGSGKTSGAYIVRDKKTGKILSGGLPPSRTLVINAEVKPDPVIHSVDGESKQMGIDYPWKIATRHKNQIDFVFNIMRHIKYSKTSEELQYWREQCVTAGLPDMSLIDFIVMDSGSAMFELINRAALDVRDKRQGWANYAIDLIEWVRDLKEYPYQMFITGLTTVDDEVEYLAVRGQAASRGAVEKEFMYVGFTAKHEHEDGKFKGFTSHITYRFYSNKYNSARAPLGVFDFDEENNFFKLYQKALVAYGNPPYELEGWKPVEREENATATY